MGDLNLRCAISGQDIIQYSGYENQSAKNLSQCYILITSNQKIVSFPLKLYYSNKGKFGNFKFYNDIGIEELFGILSLFSLINESNIFKEQKENIDYIINKYNYLTDFRKKYNDFLIPKNSKDFKVLNHLIESIFEILCLNYDFKNIKINENLTISCSIISGYAYNELIKTHPYLNLSINNSYNACLFNKENISQAKKTNEYKCNKFSLSHIVFHNKLNQYIKEEDIFNRKYKIEECILNCITYGYSHYIDFYKNKNNLLSILHHSLNKDFCLYQLIDDNLMTRRNLSFEETQKYFDIKHLNYFDKFIYFVCACSRFKISFESIQYTSAELYNEDGNVIQKLMKNIYSVYNKDNKDMKNYERMLENGEY